MTEATIPLPAQRAPADFAVALRIVLNAPRDEAAAIGPAAHRG